MERLETARHLFQQRRRPLQHSTHNFSHDITFGEHVSSHTLLQLVFYPKTIPYPESGTQPAHNASPLGSLRHCWITVHCDIDDRQGYRENNHTPEDEEGQSMHT